MKEARLAGAVAAGPVLGATVVTLGFMTPGYNQWRDTISRLGSPGQPHAPEARAGLVVCGLLILLAAGPLGMHAPRRARLLRVLLGVSGTAVVVAGIEPKAPPAVAAGMASEVHVAASVAGGAAMVAAMVAVALAGALTEERREAGGAAALSAVLIVIFPFTWGTAIYGLVERVLGATATLWVARLALRDLTGRCPARAPAWRWREATARSKPASTRSSSPA